jgi:hypothetical protein
MEIGIVAYLQNMAAGEIMQHVPPETLVEIKKTDPHPVLEAYVLGHPGESKTHVVGRGQKILKWGTAALKALKERIKPGVLAFNGHNADNSHEGRTAIGKVIAVIKSTQNEVINIIHRFRDYLHLQADVASFEAPPLNVPEGTELQGHEVQPDEIGDITGVALAHSATAKPAFAGAVKLAALQCLTKEKIMPVITFKDIQEFIKENKTSPLTIFQPSDLLKLDVIQEEVGKHKGNDNQWNEIQRLKFEISELRKENETLKTDGEKNLKEKEAEIINYKGKEIFEAQMKKREKLTDKQKTYIEKHLKKLTLEPGKEVEGQVNFFLDEKIKEFDELSKIFSPSAETPGSEKLNLNPAPVITGEVEKHYPD